MSRGFESLRVAIGICALCVAMMPLEAIGAQRLPLQITMDANNLDVREAGVTLLRYHHSGVPFKPYVKELLTPGGVNVLLDAPSDHLHHHALMFACAVNDVDFWGEAVGSGEGHFLPQPGKQRHLRFDEVNLSQPNHHPWAHFTEVLRWTSKPGNEPLLIEHRTVTAGWFNKATHLIWESKLEVPEGKESAVLSGSHYHGLGMRFIRSMDATGEFRNADNDPGVVFRGEERLTRSRWCAYTAQADGKMVTVAMFDHPKNPRSPATWFTMAKPFAYMSATLRLHEEPLKVLPGKPLTLCYGVALWDGRVETSQIDRLYTMFSSIGGRTTAELDPELAGLPEE
jgi:hypothetical protein